MKTRQGRSRRVVLYLSLAVVATSLASGALADLRAPINLPRLYPVTSAPFGNSYSDWAAAWWQWALSLPVAGHPLFDETGAQCGAGQSGPVFFLGGVFNVSGSAVRTECRVPSGKTLFFPILNVECSNVEGNGVNATELRACGDFFASLATNLRLEVNGISITHLDRFRTVTPSFQFAVPDDDLLGAFGVATSTGTCFPQADGHCEPYLSAGDGFYVMLGPLSDGRHGIRFRGTFADPINFALDVTYDLRVGG